MLKVHIRSGQKDDRSKALKDCSFLKRIIGLTKKVKIRLRFQLRNHILCLIWNSLIFSNWNCVYCKLQMLLLIFAFYRLRTWYGLGWEAWICKFGIRIGEKEYDTFMVVVGRFFTLPFISWTCTYILGKPKILDLINILDCHRVSCNILCKILMLE